MSFELRMEMESQLQKERCRRGQMVQQRGEARLLPHHREFSFPWLLLLLLAHLPRNFLQVKYFDLKYGKC
jgi:hypothetical protein